MVYKLLRRNKVYKMHTSSDSSYLPQHQKKLWCKDAVLLGSVLIHLKLIRVKYIQILVQQKACYSISDTKPRLEMAGAHPKMIFAVLLLNSNEALNLNMIHEHGEGNGK